MFFVGLTFPFSFYVQYVCMCAVRTHSIRRILLKLCQFHAKHGMQSALDENLLSSSSCRCCQEIMAQGTN